MEGGEEVTESDGGGVQPKSYGGRAVGLFSKANVTPFMDFP